MRMATGICWFAKAHRERKPCHPTPSLRGVSMGRCGCSRGSLLAGCTIGDTEGSVLSCSRGGDPETSSG